MKVLIVDDSRAMRIMLARFMTELGFETRDASNGKEALVALGAGLPDLVLVDWNMPEMNGLEFVQAVRADQRFNALPLVMVTTETEMSQMTKALEEGANEYVMKPFTKDVLQAKLEMLGLTQAG
ncbi:MAG: PleD family two-component system response regulator [Gemmatimonadales bacterium]